MHLKDEQFREVENGNELFIALGSFAIVAVSLIALVFHVENMFSFKPLANDQMLVMLKEKNHLKESQLMYSRCDLGMRQAIPYVQKVKTLPSLYRNPRTLEKDLVTWAPQLELSKPRLSGVLLSTFTHTYAVIDG